MAALCDGGPLRWRPFAMADRNRPANWPAEVGQTEYKSCMTILLTKNPHGSWFYKYTFKVDTFCSGETFSSGKNSEKSLTLQKPQPYLGLWPWLLQLCPGNDLLRNFSLLAGLPAMLYFATQKSNSTNEVKCWQLDK